MPSSCAFGSLSVEVAGETDRGLRRAFNADAYVIGGWGGLPRWCLLAAGVFDGVGTGKRSAEASALAAKCFQEGMVSASWEFSKDASIEFVRNLHQRLQAGGSRPFGRSGLATTAAIAFLVRSDPPQMAIVSVGDSQAFVVRDELIERLVPVDTVAAGLLDAGQITAGQAEVHPRRHVLTQALGCEGSIAPHVRVRSVRAGDRFLLCTDGITNSLSLEQIGAIMAGAAARDTCRKLIEAANDARGYDNSTAVVLHFRNEPHMG